MTLHQSGSIQQGDVFVPLLTQVPAVGLTLPQMKRRLEHIGTVRKFPIYVAEVNNLDEVQFVKAHGEHRPDNWAIVYVPRDGVRFPWAHWTFTQVAAPVQPDPVPHEPQEPIMMFTSAPLVPHPMVYWRCRPTPENTIQFLDARRNGWACSCCFQIPCYHEILWRMGQWVRGNAGLRVTLIHNRMKPGCARASVTGSSGHAGWSVHPAPGSSTVVVTPQGNRHVARTSRENHAILNLGFFLSMLPSSWTLYDRHFYRIPRGWVKWYRMLQCKFKWIEHPESYQDDVVVPPFKLRVQTYPSRGWVRTLFSAVRKVTFACVVVPKLVGRLVGHGLMFAKQIDMFLSDFSGGQTHVVEEASKWCAQLLLLPMVKYAVIVTCTQLFTVIMSQFLQFACTLPPKKQFGFDGDLALTLPRREEILSRLAVRDVVTRADAVDLVRRVCNEERWPNPIQRDEFAEWLTRVVTEPATASSLTQLPPGHCVTCRNRVATYRGECKICKRNRRTYRPEPLLMTTLTFEYVGRRGLWSRRPTVPEFDMKPGAYILLRSGRKIRKRSEFNEWYSKQEVVETCRGWNSGPIFMDHEPICFPHGEAVAALAFCLRLGVERLHDPLAWVWDLMEHVALRHIEPLEPESRDLFLSHFSGEKLRKMLEAEQQVELGQFEPIKEGKLAVKMKGFTKAEKGWNSKYSGDGWLKEKPVMKPRFICCPDPVVLYRLGPYTHAQTKWLARKFSHLENMFYAGCATPSIMDDWLNRIISDLPEAITYSDDITAIDSNHNLMSFAFHAKVRNKQFRGLPAWIEAAYEGEESIKIRIGLLKAFVDAVNASGVSDTSYKNTLICLFLRLLAICHAVKPLDTVGDVEGFSEAVLKCIRLSAAGDDGLVRLPRTLFGTDMMSDEARERYEEFWAGAGFSVKLARLPEHRWRMATYLAMRPTWEGDRYVWTPEPARRLKGLFWQIDNSLHPMAWARGVARQIAVMASPNPVLAPIMEWFLHNTHGPIINGVQVFGNPGSPWTGEFARKEGALNPRALEEFFIDYSVPTSSYEAFRESLIVNSSVHIVIKGHLMERVFSEES